VRQADVAIVGAGLAGSLAETMLGRAGYAVALIDPFERVRRISAAKGSRSRTRRRREFSKCHSLSIGFDADSASLPFESLTYFGEDPVQRIAYITLLPFASGLRVNLFSYHQFDAPWLRRFRDAPVAAIAEALPNLERLTAFWHAFRWACYAGSVGRNFVRHSQLPRFPASPRILKETLHSGI
jgi:phytoene dehydrogenase-like protein